MLDQSSAQMGIEEDEDINEEVLEILRSGAKDSVIQENLKQVLATTEVEVLDFSSNHIGDKGAEHLAKAVKFYNISITSLGEGFDQKEQFKPMLEQNKKIQPLMEELVEMHSKLPEPIYENITEAVKARSVSLYNTRLLSVLCKDIYKNNPNTKISCCPPKIFYEIFKIYNEPKLQKFKTEYGKIPTVCRATVELAINQIKAEISKENKGISLK